MAEQALKAGLVSYEVSPALDSYIHDSGESRKSELSRGRSTNPVPREDATLSWQNINVSVMEGKGRSVWQRIVCKSTPAPNGNIKHILNDVNGTVKPGSLLAIMGASGAGKSTLMNVLAHRNIADMQVSGTVMVNERKVGLDINTISAYVQQEDLFIGKLTVREHLVFQALLRLDKDLSLQERLYRVDQIIGEVGLRRCADTMIGIPGRMRGISGGEKKRLSFASEVLTDPAILFADEPTSGLDAFMAQTVITTLQKMAAQGRTVVCTIHQPSSEVFAMFDSLLLLAEGRVAFHGPTFQAITAFSDLGYSCPPNFNPADYFVHTLAIVPGDEERCRARIKEICDEFEEKKSSKKSRSVTPSTEDSFREDPDVIRSSPYKVGWTSQFRALLWRSWISTIRDRSIAQIRFMENIFLAVVVGLIYFQTTIDTAGVLNISGSLFFLITECSFSNLFSTIFVFPAELPVFIREHKNGIYRTDTYYLAKTIAELPMFCISSFLICVIPYWMIGLRSDAAHFFICYAVLLLATNVAVSYGYIISTISSTMQIASSIAFPIQLPLYLVGGFYLNIGSVPVYLIWVKYLSWFQYSFELLHINQWKGYGVIDNCAQIANNRTESTGCIPNGEAALEFLGVNQANLLTDIYALILLIFAFRFIAFLALLRRAYQKQ